MKQEAHTLSLSLSLTHTHSLSLSQEWRNRYVSFILMCGFFFFSSHTRMNRVCDEKKNKKPHTRMNKSYLKYESTPLGASAVWHDAFFICETRLLHYEYVTHDLCIRETWFIRIRDVWVIHIWDTLLELLVSDMTHKWRVPDSREWDSFTESGTRHLWVISLTRNSRSVRHVIYESYQ